MQEVYCRYAPSLGALEGTPEEVWGTKPYDPEKHINEPCVFFGLYGLNDFYALWRHKGKRYILWAGSDLLHFRGGYWLDERGEIRVTRGPFATWINRHCQSWVENRHEKEMLRIFRINSEVCPSYMGDKNLEVSFSPGNNVYLSCSGGLTKEYGFETIERIAGKLPEVNFNLYGTPWVTRHNNVIVHGRIPKEQMNEETSKFQLGLRLNEFDGFSEILAKAVLRGQYAIGKVKHPLIPSFHNDEDLIEKIKEELKNKKPNLVARDWYLANLNKFPFNVKDNKTA